MIRIVSFCMVLLSPSLTMSAEPSRVLVDTAGRRVSTPSTVKHVATIGAVPVLDSFLLALGEAGTIVNGVPGFTQTKRHKYLRLLAPAVFTQPITQGPAGDPNIELLKTLHPDLFLVIDASLADRLEELRIPCVVLTGQTPEDVQKSISLLGEIFGKQARAAEYQRWMDTARSRIKLVLGTNPDQERPRVLFLSLKQMGRMHQTIDWWITEAGGINVAENGKGERERAYSSEQVSQWNPDVLVVNNAAEIEQVYADSRFTELQAVKRKRVYTVPVGIHFWHRSVEQPLMLLWAAKTLTPERFKMIDLETETKAFYKEFFNYDLSSDQVAEILSGVQ